MGNVTFSFTGLDTKAQMDLAPSIEGLASSLNAGLSRDNLVVKEGRQKMKEVGLKIRKPEWLAEILNS